MFDTDKKEDMIVNSHPFKKRLVDFITEAREEKEQEIKDIRRAAIESKLINDDDSKFEWLYGYLTAMVQVYSFIKDENNNGR